MNYGKNNLSRRKKNISSKKKMQKKRVGVRLFKAVVISLLLLCVIGAAGAGVFAYQIIQNTPEVTAEDIMPQGYTSFIVDQSGNQIETLNDSSSNRVYRTYDEIPEYMAHAFVAVEDSRFYEHNGIDLQGIIRAGVIGVTNGFNFTEGASTLTQQLIKNNVFPDFVNEETLYDRVERKLQEQYLALQIEKELSKEQILEAYMNTINLGQGCLGVQAAATRYFNKDVSDLTLSECAVIAAITQNPTRYDPVKNPEENAKRRERVLNNMLEQGYISQAEYDEATSDNVYDRILETAAVTTNDAPYSYFVDALIEQLVEDLNTEKGYTETQAYNLIYSGGLTITATQDATIQKICDEEVANVGDYLSVTEYGLEFALTVHREDGTAENYSQEQLAAYIRDKYNDKYPLVFSSEDAAREMVEEYKSTLNIGENDTVDENINLTLQPQVSVVLMDQYTGQVKAIVGGRGEKTTSLSLNRATTGDPRQPGSCFKIVSTYAPALNECGLNLSSTIIDEPYEYKNGQKVNNWDNQYIGATSVRYAIEHSMNVCAVRTLTEVVGEEKSYEYLLNFGFTTLTDEDKYSQAKALGGIENGVYNIELTAAYAAIANGGVYTEPILYTQVLDHEGNVLLDNTTPDTHEVIKDSTAFLLTSAMEDVINQGTGTAARLDGMHAAGKTGTTQDSTDLWLSAYTPYYTASVWGGYDSRKPMENMNQSWHSRLWKAIMDRVHEGLNDKDFEIPSSVVQCTVCSETGLLAVSSCPSYTEYFSEENAPTQSCSGHYVEIIEEVIEEPVEEGSGEEAPAEEVPVDPNAGAVETPPVEQPVDPNAGAVETPPVEQPVDPNAGAVTDPAAPAQ
ncbi:MAG TPA: transglycosylase domain-containing protein [Candidatus Mediterraneibacter norfolkensis]|nr:transglycosylase domain-containing protein [Candidatus Mediterraneibacter norfolkensis]